MRPPNQRTFEKLKTGEFVLGEIEQVEYDMEHNFKYKEREEQAPAIRFKFKFQGYEYPHFSRWMKFNLDKKSNLYNKYVSKLVQNAKPYMDIDMDVFKGTQIKTLWEDNGEFQNLENIMPIGGKIIVTEGATIADDDFIPEVSDEDVPV